MRSALADIEIPLAEIPKAKARRNEYIESVRRYQVAISDPNKPRKAPWKKRDADHPLPPAWEFERDKQGKVTLARQLRPLPGTMDVAWRYVNRRFLSIIEGEAILVGGEHCEHGCRVDSFAENALGIHGTRGKILEEFQA